MTIVQRKPLATTAIFLSLALVTGCHKKQAAAPLPAETPAAAPAPTANITADPVAIDLGQSVVLNWRTTNADSVSIDSVGPVNANGTRTVAPTTSTDYHLVAKGDGGTAEADVRVTVRVPEVPTAPAADNTDETIFEQNVRPVFFDYDSYDIRPDARAALEQSASFLNSHPGVRIVIGGYCDDRGSAEYNLALGENRANSAKTALVNAGVAANRIRVISYGKEKQFCTEETESCWQQNRRDQFSLDR
jgi:peptidoglycan-associated lipoprotein